jgi:CheY-like chemotaxis protein
MELALPRVLVVDDEPIVGRALSLALRRVAVVTFENQPAAALERLRRGERFDLILCDVMMPAMTGPELFAQAMVFAPEMRARFVFVSGGIEGPVKRGLDATERPCLEKPLAATELRELVRQHTQRSD